MSDHKLQAGKPVIDEPGRDEGFMREALAQAALGDFPFGAVIVSEGRIVARGHNAGVRLNDPTAHGEMMAIRDFISRHPAEELMSATIYTTGEPCPMCMGALIWCGIRRVVFAAPIEELSTRIGQIATSSHALLATAPFSDIEIKGGVLMAEALALFATMENGQVNSINN
jgi:tRNA(adenine34) deaminase